MTNLKQEFPANKKIIQECINKHPSANKSFGCVDSYKYVNAVCNVMREENFKVRYKKFPRKYFQEACALSSKSEDYVLQFFDLDEKGCIKGYETERDRLLTLNKSKNLLEDDFVYKYEKKTCKAFRAYVNLCTYVDGDLKTLFPTDYSNLPKIDYNSDIKSICSVKNPDKDALYKINHDIKYYASSPNVKPYDKVIMEYRSRIPASVPGKDRKNRVCVVVRNSYDNLGCSRYEKSSEGDPIYFTAEEMRLKRIEENENIKKINNARGGLNTSGGMGN
ncbi:hypothetical protein K2P97_12705 [bacterium]|nr:hypothetical protein [bacterium]